MAKIKTIRDDILDDKEVIYTIQKCTDNEVRAVIAMLWITGARISEILLLKLRDLKDSSDHVVINMPTLKQRKVVIPRRKILLPKNAIFYPYIKNHVNRIHPKRPDSNLFLCSRKRVWRKMKEANPDAYPHLFRHSRATMLSEKIDIFDLKYTFGWANMDMPQRYVHRKNSPQRVFEAMNEEQNESKAE